MNVIQRLEYKDVFYDIEKPNTILELLERVPISMLLTIIGFCNTKDLPNYDNFFSNKEQQKEINERVKKYIKGNNFNGRLEVISPYGSLKLAEIILSNIDDFSKEDSIINEVELNIFKAFLLINEEINGIANFEMSSQDSFSKFIDYTILLKFIESDIGIYDDIDLELIKVFYCTLYKVDILLKFIESNELLNPLKNRFLQSFGVDSNIDFLEQMKLLFGNLIILKSKNEFKLDISNTKSGTFLKSITNVDTSNIDEDFTFLKKKPIYFIDDYTISIVNYFFVADKFYKGAKFRLKELYEETYSEKSRENFNGFFNKRFSEEVLMKSVLDGIFDRKYFVKKPQVSKEIKGEPDYYLRYNNSVFIFENKDSLVASRVKASGDIAIINQMLKSKFLLTDKKKVGIGQLVNSIKVMLKKECLFDDYVNLKSKNNLDIFPILLIHDRVFQCPGINYKLNLWFKQELHSNLYDDSKSRRIRDLIVLDIDTLIVLLPFIKNNFKQLKEIFLDHIFRMNLQIKPHAVDSVDAATFSLQKQLSNILCSISHRESTQKLDVLDLVTQFDKYLNDVE